MRSRGDGRQALVGAARNARQDTKTVRCCRLSDEGHASPAMRRWAREKPTGQPSRDGVVTRSRAVNVVEHNPIELLEH